MALCNNCDKDLGGTAVGYCSMRCYRKGHINPRHEWIAEMTRVLGATEVEAAIQRDRAAYEAKRKRAGKPS